MYHLGTESTLFKPLSPHPKGAGDSEKEREEGRKKELRNWDRSLKQDLKRRNRK